MWRKAGEDMGDVVVDMVRYPGEVPESVYWSIMEWVWG